MKKAIILEKMTSVFFYLFLIFTLVFFWMTLTTVLAKSSMDYAYTINGLKIEGPISIPMKIAIGISVFSGILLVYALYLFRENTRLFVKKKFFSLKVITNFHNIGICLISYSLIQFFIYFVFYAVSETKATSYHFKLYGLLYGFFFFVIADIFKLAKQEEEENKLTI